jgi:hypothetical protein
VRLRRPLVFLVVPTYWETRFSSRRYSTYFFFSSLLGHLAGHPTRHDARILLYECILDALSIFSSSFRSIGSQLPTGCYSTSLRSARLHTGRLLSRFVLFFFWTDVHAIRPVYSSRACETWVPLGPHRLGSQPSLTSRSDLLEDPQTC